MVLKRHKEVDTLTPTQRSERMSRIRSKNTKPEMLVRSALHLAGLRFRLHRKGLPGRPDIVFPKEKVAVFVHGCFWHRHERCSKTRTPKTRVDFWETKFAGNVARDKATFQALNGIGWAVYVIWECELPNGIEAHVSEIRKLVSDRR